MTIIPTWCDWIYFSHSCTRRSVNLLSTPRFEPAMTSSYSFFRLACARAGIPKNTRYFGILSSFPSTGTLNFWGSVHLISTPRLGTRNFNPMTSPCITIDSFCTRRNFEFSSSSLHFTIGNTFYLRFFLVSFSTTRVTVRKFWFLEFYNTAYCEELGLQDGLLWEKVLVILIFLPQFLS